MTEGRHKQIVVVFWAKSAERVVMYSVKKERGVFGFACVGVYLFLLLFVGVESYRKQPAAYLLIFVASEILHVCHASR